MQADQRIFNFHGLVDVYDFIVKTTCLKFETCVRAHREVCDQFKHTPTCAVSVIRKNLEI